MDTNKTNENKLNKNAKIQDDLLDNFIEDTLSNAFGEASHVMEKIMSTQLKSVPRLEDGQVYIYVVQSTNRRCKIGITSDIASRYASLSASNSQGFGLESEVYLSPATWLRSIETSVHTHFSKWRFPGTEWFNVDLYEKLKKKSFVDDAVKYLDQLFTSDSYDKCNELRKQVTQMTQKEKERGDVNGE